MAAETNEEDQSEAFLYEEQSICDCGRLITDGGGLYCSSRCEEIANPQADSEGGRGSSMSQPTRYEYGRAIEVIRTILELFEDGTFVRNTKDDGEFSKFASQSFRISAVLSEAQKVVQEFDNSGAEGR